MLPRVARYTDRIGPIRAAVRRATLCCCNMLQRVMRGYLRVLAPDHIFHMWTHMCVFTASTASHITHITHTTVVKRRCVCVCVCGWDSGEYPMLQA